MKNLLFNPNALDEIRLYKAELIQMQDDTVTQLNNKFTDPLVRYGVAVSILKAMTAVTDNMQTAAEEYCEQQNLGTDGKQFVHDNHTFSRQFNISYNYAANATDEDDDPVPYTLHLQKVEERKRSLKAARELVKADQTVIECAHPNMQPLIDSVILKFHGRNDDLFN